MDWTPEEPPRGAVYFSSALSSSAPRPSLSLSLYCVPFLIGLDRPDTHTHTHLSSQGHLAPYNPLISACLSSADGFSPLCRIVLFFGTLVSKRHGAGDTVASAPPCYITAALLMAGEGMRRTANVETLTLLF